VKKFSIIKCDLNPLNFAVMWQCVTEMPQDLNQEKETAMGNLKILHCMPIWGG
jgi:hypothetical protein